MVSYKNLRMVGTSYLREGYIFECLQESHFGTLLKIVGQNKLIDDVIKDAREETVHGKPLCKIWKVEQV